jgi:putative NIF3 family GTP cyclohydrolase 1 type 2
LAAKPYSGQPGSHHTTPEVRLEIILPSNLRDKADLAVRASHPYEEPAFEFYEITATGAGFGLVGRWNPARNGQETIAFLTKILGLNGLWAGPEVGTVAAVALMPGSGGDYLTAAKKAGADLLVTGDVNHHQALLAQEISLPVFSAGHFETERPSIPRLARELQKHMERLAEGVKLTILEENPPFRRM